jgi:hypothetical protein
VGRRGGPRPPAWGAAALVLRRRGARPGRTGCPRVHAAPKPRSTIGITSSSLGSRGRAGSLRRPSRLMAVPVAGAAVGPARCRSCHHAADEEPARAMTPGDGGSGGWGGGRPCARSAPHPGCWAGGGPHLWVVGASPAPFIPDKRAKAGNRYRRASPPFEYGGHGRRGPQQPRGRWPPRSVRDRRLRHVEDAFMVPGTDSKPMPPAPERPSDARR